MGDRNDFFTSLRAVIADFLEVSPDNAAARDAKPQATGKTQDADRSLDGMKAALGRAIVFHRKLTKERDQLGNANVSNNEGPGSEDKAAFAIRHGRDDLARAAIAQARVHETRIKEVDRVLALLSREIDALKNLIETQSDGEAASDAEDEARAALLSELDRLMANDPAKPANEETSR